jgi:hypothetical protein
MKILKEDIKSTETFPDGSFKITHDDGTEIYYNKNKFIHRDDDLPAVIDKKFNSKEWYKNNELHRINGPAIEYDNGNTTWYKNGKKHRLDGPALDWKHSRLWIVNGKEITNWINFYKKNI